jgi:hypothetical protein
MKKSILRYLLMIGAIAAPTKANNTVPVVPQTPEQLLEEAFRSLLIGLWTFLDLLHLKFAHSLTTGE